MRLRRQNLVSAFAIAVAAIASDLAAPADTHRRRQRDIPSRRALCTSDPAGLDTNRRPECRATASYCPAAASVLAALDTNQVDRT